MGRSLGLLASLSYGARAVLGKAALALMVTVGAVQAEEVVVVALGDSLTQGFGLPAEDGFVPQMQAWLRGQGAEVTVINAGVSGDTTAGGLSRVAWTLSPEVDAMVVALGGNDLLRGLDPEMSRTNLTGILQAGQDAGVAMLLVGMEAPTNFGPAYKEDFDAIYPDLAAQFDLPLYPIFFAGLLEEGDLATVRATYMQADGVHPNAAGVTKIVEAMGPAWLDLIQSVD